MKGGWFTLMNTAIRNPAKHKFCSKKCNSGYDLTNSIPCEAMSLGCGYFLDIRVEYICYYNKEVYIINSY